MGSAPLKLGGGAEMPITLNKLSQKTIINLSRPGYYGDGGGLWLQVAPTGAKTWIFRYTRNGKTTEMGLGGLTSRSLLRAREKAAELREMLADGIDPLAQRRQQQATESKTKAKAMTFQECADEYIKTHRSGWKNPKHAEQWENTIRDYCGPYFGNLPVADVETELVRKSLAAIWQDKNETAMRLRGRIERVLDWATVSGLRQGENPARWKGHLEHLLTNISREGRIVHHAALPYQDAGAFMESLRACVGSGARALEFLILTAARTGEVIGATWGEIDDVTKTWTIPAERMKAGKEHRVPLSDQAWKVIQQMRDEASGDYIFSGRGANKPLSNMAMLAVLKRMKRPDLTAHGFRSTFRDWAAETTAYPHQVQEMALAHTIENKTEKAYRRGDLFDKRRRLMSDWAGHCDKTQKVDADVVPIRGAA